MRRSGELSSVLVAIALLSCAGSRPGAAAPTWARALPASLSIEGDLLVRPDATDGPSVELRFAWRNDEALLGWGAAHVWARPHKDHVSVTAILDAPSRRARWERCRSVELVVDGAPETVSARYIRTPMDGALVYEAVHLDLGVQHLRALSRPGAAAPSICGDTLELSPAQRATLGRFVEWFDHLAARRWLGDMPSFRDVGPRPSLPYEDEDLEPTAG